VTVNVPLTHEVMRQTSRKRMIAAHNILVQRRRARDAVSPSAATGSYVHAMR
jgi:hypothetical protein